MLEYCWLFSLFLSRSARCFTHLQGEMDSAPTYLAAILSPDSTFKNHSNHTTTNVFVGKIFECIYDYFLRRIPRREIDDEIYKYFYDF